MGHMQRDCPSQRAYIVTEDGGYVSTSDVEDEKSDDKIPDDDDGQVFGGDDTSAYRTIIVERALSAQVCFDKIQWHNLFQIYFVIKNRRACVIIDGGSCNNLVSTDLITNLTYPHVHIHIRTISSG